MSKPTIPERVRDGLRSQSGRFRGTVPTDKPASSPSEILEERVRDAFRAKPQPKSKRR